MEATDTYNKKPIAMPMSHLKLALVVLGHLDIVELTALSNECECGNAFLNALLSDPLQT